MDGVKFCYVEQRRARKVETEPVTFPNQLKLRGTTTKDGGSKNRKIFGD